MTIRLSDQTPHYQGKKRLVVSEEKKKKHRAINASENDVRQYRIDGDVITGKQKRCDYLLLNDTKRNAYFIELKGSSIDQACKQLLSVWDIFEGCPDLKEYVFLFRIVYSGSPSPSIIGSSERKLKQRTAKTKPLKVDGRKVKLYRKESALLEEYI